jgi:hypothetical protein
MKSYDYEAVSCDGAIYCTQCLPAGITEDSEGVHPVFADSEWDYYPVCDHCHGVHDYVSLTSDGLQAFADFALAKSLKDGTKLDSNVRLVSATSRFGRSIPVYDDGFGSLWIHRDSMGISGIVRAQTWETAYEICEDEFFPAADKEAGYEYDRIEAMPEGKERAHIEDCWSESYGYRSNARKEPDGTLSSIYAKDLNGDRLEPLTDTLCAELEITLKVEHE